MDSLKAPAPQQETKLHFLDYWRIIRIRKTVILAVFLLVVITATLVTFFLPERYASTARIKVERDQTDIASVMQAQTYSGAYDPYFIQTEFEVIQSEVILAPVITNLNLNVEWGKKYLNAVAKTSETMTWLKAAMDLRPVRNTSLIEIRVSSEDAKEAAKIANSIAETYRKHRVEQRIQLTKGGIDVLKEQVEEQNKKIEDAQKYVDDMRERLKIPDALSAGDMPTMLLTAETLRKVEGIRIEAQMEYVRQDTLLKKLKELKTEELAQALPTAAQDSILTSLLEQLNSAGQKLAAAKREYGADHAEVRKASATVEDLHTNVKSRVYGIMVGLEAKVQSLKEGLDKIQVEVNKATKTDIDQATKSRPYFEAKRKVEELQRFANVLNMKVSSEKTDLVLPKTSMVEIVDHAVPAMRPFRPNKSLNIAIGLGVGGVLGLSLSGYVYLLQVSSFRRTKREAARLLLRRVAYTCIAIIVAVIMGYFCAFLYWGPYGFDLATMISVPVVLLIGTNLCAFIEIKSLRAALEELAPEVRTVP
jgi:polysaccharide biosynthesis transport protein